MNNKEIKYARCVTCEKLDAGKCNGPDFTVLQSFERIDWLNARADFLGMTNARIAEKSRIPKSTIDGILSGHRPNPTTETIRKILLALGVQDFGDCPCPNPEHIEALEAELEQLRAQLAGKDEEISGHDTANQVKIDHLQAEIKHLDTETTRLAEANAEYKAAVRRKDKLIRTLFLMLVCLLAILALMFAFDLLIPGFGLIRG